MKDGLKGRLIAQARAEGFAGVGICAPDAIPQAAERLAEYVARGRNGQMGWMAERMEWRGNPAALWPEARSVIMLAEAYTPGCDPLAVLESRDRGAVSVYAQGKDYHDIVKKRLKRLGRWLIEEARKTVSDPAEIKVFVDTAPVMEKPLAQAAGLGWQGKHTNVLSRDLGTCRACLDICPTRAFPAPWQLDARRCISYLTIEHKGPVDEDLRPLLGNRIYGCDDCLAVCPWNKFAQAATEIGYQPKVGAPELAGLAALDDAAFRAMFSGSPVKRIGRDRFVRNVLYAIGNSGAAALRGVALALSEDADAAVADAARWAAGRLAAG